jgi:hypothetical protein
MRFKSWRGAGRAARRGYRDQMYSMSAWRRRSLASRALAGLVLAFLALPAMGGAGAGAETVIRAPGGSDRGVLEVLRVLDGIPIHRIAVPTLPHDSVGIRIDGVVDEPVWATVSAFDNMLVSVPATGRPGRYPTEVRMLATERGLYVSAILYQDVETLVKRSSARDQTIDRDMFGVTLDTTGEGKFAYWFNLALGDSQMDGKVLPERNYSIDWDGPWIGRTAVRDDGWSAEMFLPWSMMNLPHAAGPRVIGFGTTRQVSHENVRYQWPGHSYTSPQFVSALNQMVLEGVAPRNEISFIPFASVTVDEWHDETDLRVGADVTWKPSPAAEMAGTLLPDFGSVEADEVVLNLTAQETFFPEKRLFFLEGNEVFVTSSRASAGNQQRFTTNENYATTSRRLFWSTYQPAPISLLNTRRIGGTPTQVPVPPGITPVRGEFQLPTDLLGAVKLTGGAGPMRYGVLGAFEEDVDLVGTDAAGNRARIRADGRDFGAVRMLYERVGASRHAIGYLGTQVRGPLYDAIVHGVDARFTSADGHWMAETLISVSDVDSVTGRAAQFDLQYTRDSHIQHRFVFDWFDEDVNFNELGFLQRNDYWSPQYSLLYAAPSRGGRLSDVRGTVILNPKFNVSEGYLVDGGIFWRNSMVLPGRNTLRTGIGYRPRGYEDRDSRGNGAYKTDGRVWTEIILATDASSRYSFSFNLGAEQEHLGDWTYLVGGGVTWRPTNQMTVDLDVKYRDRNGWMVYQGGRNFGRFDAGDLQPALKLNWFVTSAHQLGLTAQWAGVRAKERGFFAVPEGDGRLVPTARTLPNHDFTVSLFTLQARYRWEIAPLTDFYLVYNRGNTLPNQVDASFGDLLSDAFRKPIINNFVAKLRWRFSN